MTDDGWKISDGLNVFQMIAAHGGPGLWVRRITWGATCARIVAVGEFTGPAPYFGSPSVLMDVFTLDGELKDELAQLPVPGTYKTWRRWPEPEWASENALRPMDDPGIAQALHALEKKRHKLPGMQHAARPSPDRARAMPSEEGRIYLTVPFARKEEAKGIGARWSPENRSWWISGSSRAALTKAKKLGFLPNVQE